MTQTGCFVDYKNDCFRMNVSCQLDKDPLREVMSDIAQYIHWMEREYHYGSTSRLDMDKSLKDDWYFKRISWLHRLVNLLEIPTTEIANRMRTLWTPYIEEKYGPMNVEESIRHFLLSWEIWGKCRFSLGRSKFSESFEPSHL